MPFLSSSPIILRQSASELLALALTHLFPGLELVDGGATEQGFFVDFLAEQPINDTIIPLIEERMRGDIKALLPIESIEMMRENGAVFLEHRGQFFKAALVRQAFTATVVLNKIGDFVDYLPAAYLDNTGEIGPFKLFPIENLLAKNGIRRIEGVVFQDKETLKNYLKGHRASTKKKNISSKVYLQGKLGDTWTTEGILLKERLATWWRQAHLEEGFLLLSSPPLVEKKVIDTFQPPSATEPLLTEYQGKEYQVPSSFLPGHAALIDGHTPLPLRYAEWGTRLHERNEQGYRDLKEGRLVTAEEAHIFCCEGDLEREVISSLQFIEKMVKMLGFECQWYFTVPRATKQTSALQERAVSVFLLALQRLGIPFTQVESPFFFRGVGAEVWWVDPQGKEWSGPKVTVDLETPRCWKVLKKKLGPHVPSVIVARSLFGSLERFIDLMRGMRNSFES